MNLSTSYAGVGERPGIYAGRFIDQVADVKLPSHYSIRGESDVPSRLSAVVDEATTLIVLDPHSFPFEAMTEDRWDVPLVVVLPSGLDAESLTATFGATLFERLVFFDRIATPDSDVWKGLRQRYWWAESQRIRIETDDPGEVAATLGALFEAEQYWKGGADTPPRPLPHRTIGYSPRDPRSNKAVHRVQAEVLRPRFVAAREERADDVPLDVLEVGTGVGCWAASFDPTTTRFSGVDTSEDMIRTARANFPGQRFDRLGSDLLFPYEDQSFDLVFSESFMHHNSAPAKRTLLSEMWRVARPGGRLLFLEIFVFTRHPEEPDIHPMSVTEFVDLILEATAGQVALEHVESLRYPGEDLHRGGLISLSRLGVTKVQ
jgi:SAM-dependent methyltransferase